ncbi:APC family permease [Erythrobacter sp. NE805]|uniref:APC family permease n=1 Tax=Erythrobacter sp. NE805 TaxID=3389875 RepID=UPI00396B039A
MGFWSAALLPINGMIGAGVFALPAILAAQVGSFAPWMMLVGLALVLPLGLVFAALAGRFEAHGGPVLYATTAFGSFVGFQAGWARYASGVVSMAANTHVAIAYLAVLFPVLGGEQARQWAAAGFLASTVIVNLVGMRTSVGTLGILTAIKLLPLAALAIAGLALGEPAIGVTLPPLGELEGVVLLTFYALMSFENATILAGEMRNPKRDAPRTVLVTLGAVALLYALVIWSYLAIGPVDAEGDNALATAAGKLAGAAGVLVLTLAAAVSIGANTLAGGLGLPRLTFAMAEQGILPRIFAHVSPRLKTPDVSILFFGAAAIGVSLLGGFTVLAVASTLARLVMYLLTALSLPVIAGRSGEPRVWWHIPVAALAVAATLWVAAQASREAFVMLAAMLGFGTVLFLFARAGAMRAAQVA